MTEKLSMDMINHSLAQIENINNNIYNMKNNIKTLENTIINIKIYLKNNCNHNKIIDVTSYDERTSYICSICQQDL
jgi:hypothetical protein